MRDEEHRSDLANGGSVKVALEGLFSGAIWA